MRFLRFRRPSPAMVVAMLALLVALGGTAGANPSAIAALISGTQIKDNSVTTKDVKNKSLLAGDFKPGQLPRGAQGPQGPQGPAGANGANGAPGAPAAKYWAGIQSSGAIARQSGGVSSSLETNGGTTNHYIVHFPTDVSQCAYTATGGDMGTLNNVTNLFARVVVAARSSDSNNDVVVQVHAFSNDFNPITDDFFIAVFC
jgi:hypothetical protein